MGRHGVRQIPEGSEIWKRYSLQSHRWCPIDSRLWDWCWWWWWSIAMQCNSCNKAYISIPHYVVCSCQLYFKVHSICSVYKSELEKICKVKKVEWFLEANLPWQYMLIFISSQWINTRLQAPPVCRHMLGDNSANAIRTVYVSRVDPDCVSVWITALRYNASTVYRQPVEGLCWLISE